MEGRDTNSGFKPKIIIISLIVLVLIIVFVWFVFGSQGILKAFFILIEIIFGAIVLLGLMWLGYELFIKKQKFDPTYVNKKKLIEASTQIKRPFLKDIYVSGDKAHTRGLIGNIKGYVRIQTILRKYLYDDKIDEKTGNKLKVPRMIADDNGVMKQAYELEKQEQDVFYVKPKGALAALFGKDMVIRVRPEDHDDLVGDVTLFGFSLIPISEYWFLNNDHLDVQQIDFNILKEAERTVAFVTMTDMKEFVDKATGIDAEHKKGIERKSLVDIPETQQVGHQSRYE